MQPKFILITILLLSIFHITHFANDPTDQTYFFIQITDPQFGMFEKNEGFEKETALYEKAVVEINRLKPDFVIITGDFVNDGKDETQIAEFKRITGKINIGIPVYYLPGNHDVGGTPDKESLSAFKKNYGYDRFSFKHKGSRFIGFNTSLIKSDLPVLEKRQLKWLKNALKNHTRYNHMILFCHYPFFNKNIDEPEKYSNITPEKRMKYLELFNANNVEAIFSGHYHNNALTEYGQIQLVTTSAIGKPLGEAPSGFRIVKVYSDHIEHNYYGVEKVPEKVEF